MTDIPHPAETADQPPRGFAPAVRERHFARIAIEGPKGAGKSRLALQFAKILTAMDHPVAAIDTEHRRLAAFAPNSGEPGDASLREPPWEFWHHCWTGSFDPMALVRRAEVAADAVGPNGVVVIDSLSPFWSGRGGVQDIVDNSPSGWKVGAPVHRDMLDALARLPCHLIVTMRSKTEYVVEEKDMGGRLVHAVRRLGGAPDQRLGIDFEFEMIITLDTDHRFSVAASACPPEFTLTSVEPSYSADVAEAYAIWISEGVERISRSDVNAMLSEFDRVDEPAERSAMKQDFVTKFGPPEDLLAEQADEARKWVNARVDAWLAPPDMRVPEHEVQPVAEQPSLPVEPEEVPVEDVGDGLAGKDKAELIQIAEGVGAAIDKRWGAARIAETIRSTMSALAEVE